MKVYEITFRVPKNKSMRIQEEQTATRQMRVENLSEIIEFWKNSQDNILKIERLNDDSIRID